LGNTEPIAADGDSPGGEAVLRSRRGPAREDLDRLSWRQEAMTSVTGNHRFVIRDGEANTTGNPVPGVDNHATVETRGRVHD
jgi:hypothetical protein